MNKEDLKTKIEHKIRSMSEQSMADGGFTKSHIDALKWVLKQLEK